MASWLQRAPEAAPSSIPHLKVVLDVDGSALLVDVHEGVATVPVHVAVAVRNPTVTEEERDLCRNRRRGAPSLTLHPSPFSPPNESYDLALRLPGAWSQGAER